MIELIPHGSLVITGGAKRRRDLPPTCCSVDEHAYIEAARLGYETKVMRADWDAHGKRAGFIRNIAMLDERPVLVLAFQFNGSRGTGHTIREAYKRGIAFHRFTEADLLPDIAALDAGDEE